MVGILATLLRPDGGSARPVKIANIALRRPTLDDVFLTLTGRAAEELENEPEA